MKKVLSKILPENKKDVYFWLLFAALLMPIIYISCQQYIDYMMLNFFLLCVIVGFMLFKVIKNLINKKKFSLPKSWALLILAGMVIWMFIAGFFSQDLSATWFGAVGEYHSETSVFQFLYYFVVALMVVLMDKKNLKHLIYTMLLVINTIIIIQFFKQDYGYGFINRNHTGYYLSVSVSVTIGMILYSKNKWELIALFVSLVLHSVSIVLNGSLGPIIGLIALFIFSLIYYLIHNRKVLIRLSIILLTVVSIFTFFDFVPKVRDLRSEESPIVVQLTDVGLVALKKLNIISEDKFNEIVDNKGGLTSGADGYDRFDMWKVSINNMIEHPFFGVGSGAWNSYNEGMPNRAPHNEFLEYGVSGGFPVLILYLAFFVYLFIMFRKKHKTLEPLAFITCGAIINYLTQSFFGNIMPFTAPAFYFVIGIAIKYVDLNLEKQDKNNDIIEANKENSEEVLNKEEINQETNV